MSGKALVVLCGLLVASLYIYKDLAVDPPKEPSRVICINEDGDENGKVYAFGYAAGAAQAFEACAHDYDPPNDP